jgi:hypothetical protein
MNLSEGKFPVNPFPVKGVILGDKMRLMVNLVCRRKINPQKTIRVWFIIDTGSKATFLAEKTIAALSAPNDYSSPLWVAIQVCFSKFYTENSRIQFSGREQQNMLPSFISRQTFS